MRDRFADFERAGVAALVISFAPAAALAGYQAHLALPFPVAADDAARSAYRAYGLGSGSRWQLWHPRVLWRYAVLLARGMKLARPPADEDLAQLGGDFIVGGDGTLRFAHRSVRPDDRPPVERLLAVTRELFKTW